MADGEEKRDGDVGTLRSKVEEVAETLQGSDGVTRSVRKHDFVKQSFYRARPVGGWRRHDDGSGQTKFSHKSCHIFAKKGKCESRR